MNAPPTSTVKFAVDRDVAVLTLDSPPLNILTAAMMDEISAVVEQVAADSTLKALAVTATGKAFSAGADVGEHAPDKAPEMIAAFSRMFDRFSALEIPVVMLVAGAALGGGFELALMADVLIATEKASFGQPEIRLGFIAPVGIAALPARVGYARAVEITCSGRKYSAAEMLSAGLVTTLVAAQADPAAALEAVLSDFRQASPLILRMTMRTLKRTAGLPFTDARRTAEAVFLNELMATDDVREGIASFFEKRAPVWKNR